MDTILKKLKYHPETGIEMTISDYIEFGIQEDSVVSGLLKDKDILLDTNCDMKNKLEQLIKENLFLVRRLDQVETENEQLKKSKAFGDAFRSRRKRYVALKRIIEASNSNQSYENLERDIEFCKKF